MICCQHITFIHNNYSTCLTGTTKENVVRDIKEKLCHVCTEDFYTHSKRTMKELEQTYRLPDDRVITLDFERTQCPEALFKPALIGTDAFGISESCCNAIERCTARDLHPVLYRNIIIAGGNTLFSGFKERLRCDLEDFAPLAIRDVKVDGTVDQAHAAWRGGAIIGSSSSFIRDRMITKNEYEERGVTF